MEIWSKCDICGRDIPVGELCYGLKKGNCICKDCCTGFENYTFTLAPAPTLTPPNEPLSIEQLREMGGQPVYMPDTNCWALVTQNAFCPILTFPDGEKCSVYDWYEQVGPVYRRPPEREEDT